MSNTIIEWLDEVYPDKAPLTQLTEWEYGELAGQRILIENLKIKLKVELDKEKEVIK